MGLDSIIENAVEIAFSSTKDLVGSGVLVSAATGAYDPITESLSTAAVRHTGLRMLKVAVSQKDIEATQATLADCKILVPKRDLQGITPKVSDTLELNGFSYNILSVREVPGKSIFSIMCLSR